MRETLSIRASPGPTLYEGARECWSVPSWCIYPGQLLATASWSRCHEAPGSRGTGCKGLASGARARGLQKGDPCMRGSPPLTEAAREAWLVTGGDLEGQAVGLDGQPNQHSEAPQCHSPRPPCRQALA